MTSDIKAVDMQTSSVRVQARTPLKFGAVIMDDVEILRVKVTAENGRGETADGWGAMFLADMWAWPTPQVPHEAKAAFMHDLALNYADMVHNYGRPAHPVDLFFDLEDDLRRENERMCRQRGLSPAQPFLGALVCASAVDAAMHDAFGNVNGIDSYQGYGPQFMGDLSRYLGAEFNGRYIADFLRPAYLERLPIFHLVGGLDKLTTGELDGSEPADGLPNCLEDWIRRDGVYCLKVKLRGTDLEWDIERMLEVHDIGARILAEMGHDTLHLTADTNEQCDSPEYVITMLEQIRERSPQCYDRILYIEQPTGRDLEADNHDMRPLSAMKPVIVDESLSDLHSFNVALEQGWSGAALKTCKGHSGALVFAAKAEKSGIPYSVQDLTLPGMALVHSVGMAARLHTILGVEYNSRQFFPEATTAQERQVHGPVFDVVCGEVSTRTLQGTGLGLQMDRVLAE